MTTYAPEQDVVWYKQIKGGGRTLGKFLAVFLERRGQTKLRIKIKSTGEIKDVPYCSVMALHEYRGSRNDLR